MKIGIDARVLAKAPHTGVGVFTQEMMKALFRNFPEERFVIFSSSGNPVSPLVAAFKKYNNVALHHVAIPNRVLDPLFRMFSYPKLDRMVGGVDVWFSPHMLLTPLSKAPRVLVIHDLSFVRFPEFYSLASRGHRLWHWLMDPKTQAKQAAQLVVLSHSTAKDLEILWGISNKLIAHVSSGIPESPIVSRSDSSSVAFREKYRLPEGYIAYLGELVPRKNILGIIRAFEMLQQKANQSNRMLVLAGPWGWGRSEVERVIGRSAKKNQIRVLGYISDEEKPALYTDADVFVYPSFFEGFGFPPLEAMAAGVPVIISNRGALPESAGEAAIMVNPYKPEELAEAIAEVLEDRGLRETLRAKGRAHAAKFSWDRAAQEMMGVLRVVIRENRA